MHKQIAAATAVLALCLTGAKLLITENQAIVSGALDGLEFEFDPPPSGVVGAPPVFKATKKTLQFLEGRRFQIQGDGTIKEIKDR